MRPYKSNTIVALITFEAYVDSGSKQKSKLQKRFRKLLRI